MLVRDAIEKDVDSINHIYNYEVLNGVATFDTEPKTYEERLEWLNHHSPKYLRPIFLLSVARHLRYI